MYHSNAQHLYYSLVAVGNCLLYIPGILFYVQISYQIGYNPVITFSNKVRPAQEKSRILESALTDVNDVLFEAWSTFDPRYLAHFVM